MEITETPPLLTDTDIEKFKRDGYLLLPGFYAAEELEPIQRQIHSIIGIIIANHLPDISQPAFTPATFDAGFQEIIARDRQLGAVIYDAVKQIPAFVRLVGNPRHGRLMSELRGTDAPAVAAGGYGVRIDNPGEDRFRANWHQEYPYNLRSVDGLVLWSPLVDVDQALGPVIIAEGSHREGLVPVVTNDPAYQDKPGAYAWHLHDEQKRLEKYEHRQFETTVGDLMIIDYLTLHASGENVSQRSRWTMQMRYFNFREPVGQKIHWQGGVNAGKDFQKFHPELYIDMADSAETR